MSKTAFATDNLEERLQVTESFVKDSGSSVDKQARTIFDELMTPTVAKIKLDAVQENNILREDIKNLKD